MAFPKRKVETPRNEVITELDRRVAEFEREDRDLCEEQVRLEQAHVTALPPGIVPTSPQLAAEAAAELDGAGVDAKPAIGAPEQRLFEVIQRRRKIKEILRLAQQRTFRLRLANAGEMVGDLEETWKKNIRAAATHLLAIQELAAERASLVLEWNARVGLGIGPPFPCKGQADAAAGPMVVGDAAYTFLAAARRERLIQSEGK